MTTQKRQFITDEAGKPVAVILSLEDYARVRSILEPEQSEEDKLALLQEAANDEAFLADLWQVLDDEALLSRSADDLQAELADLEQDIAQSDLNEWLAAFDNE